MRKPQSQIRLIFRKNVCVSRINDYQSYNYDYIIIICSRQPYEYIVSQPHSRPKMDAKSRLDIMSPRTDLVDYDTCALSGDNIVLSGTQLKNTKKLFAVCVYGGRETKVGFFSLYQI